MTFEIIQLFMNGNKVLKFYIDHRFIFNHINSMIIILLTFNHCILLIVIIPYKELLINYKI